MRLRQSRRPIDPPARTIGGLRGKKVGILAALLLTGCSPPLGQKPAVPQRPPCADKVAAAWTSTTPVKGAYACMVLNESQVMTPVGITSDDSWAAHNAASGARPPFVYETRLADGAFVYRQDIKVNGGVASIDLLIWLTKGGWVYNLDYVSAFD